MAAAERLKRPRYQCDSCQRAYSREDRKRLKCGWIPETEWVPKEKRERTWGAVAGSGFIPQYCPGYTTRLAKVQEAARAWGWEQTASGAVRRYEALGLEFTEDISNLMDVFAGEQSAAQSYEIEERRKNAQ